MLSVANQKFRHACRKDTANLKVLNETARLSYVDELIHRKQTGTEKGTLELPELDFYRSEYLRLVRALEDAYQHSRLPETPTGKAALHDLLVRLRLRAV